MLYLEYRPAAPLCLAVRSLWYVRRPTPACSYEAVMPGVHAELILNLHADSCTAVGADGSTTRQSATLVAGLRTERHTIATADTAETVGAVLTATGVRRLFPHPAHSLRSLEIPLGDLLGDAAADRLRSTLQAVQNPRAKLRHFELALRPLLREHAPHPAVMLALEQLRRPGCRVEELEAVTGLSARRLRSVFEEEVGAAPKTFARLLRFRRAMRCLHRGDEVRWAELALGCGYADQAHFNHDFRAFSGINPTTYVRASRPWAGHVALPISASERR